MGDQPFDGQVRGVCETQTGDGGGSVSDLLEEHHGPLAAKIPVVHRYVQSHLLLSGYRAAMTPLYDGIAETWFDDTNAMRVSRPPRSISAVRADEPNLSTPTNLAFIITKEHVKL